MFFPPSLSQTRDTVIKEKMLLPEASSPSLPLSLHPHPTLSCYGGDAFTTEFCFELLSLSFYSLSLSCFVLLPISPPSLWIEKERCWFPKAGCSSLNNSSWFPVVLSPVLHQSITPLHKDVQMGWDPYVHAHFRQKHKHGPVRVPMVIHTAMRVSQCTFTQNVCLDQVTKLPSRCFKLLSTLPPITESKTNLFQFSSFAPLFFLLSLCLTHSVTHSLSFLQHPPPHSLRIHRRLMRTQHRLAYLPAFLPSVQQKSLTVTQWLHQKHQ